MTEKASERARLERIMAERIMALEHAGLRCPARHPDWYARCEKRTGHDGPHAQQGLRLHQWTSPPRSTTSRTKEAG